jgi:hypothetical protein
MRRSILLVFVALCFGTIAAPALADNRVALVIGNGAYTHVPHLPNPSHDAEDVAAALKRTGFQTIVGIDLDQAGMQDAAIRFARAARTADIALFYYSGHALQFAGVNYMVPVDAQLRDEADLRRMTRVDEVVADLQQAKNLRILVLDSCRDNPLADELKRSIGITRSSSIGRGLARFDSLEGMIVAYATQAGRTAEDGNGRNSPYTAAFLRNVEAKEEIGTIFRRISADVYQTTRQAQLPELSLSLIGEFYLNGKLQVTVAPATPPAPVDPCAAAESHWKSVEAIATFEAYQDHLDRFPNCTFAGLAKARITSLSNKVAVIPPLASPTVPPVSTPPASSPRIDRLDDIKPGVVSLSEAKTIKDANISTGQRLEGGSPKIVSVSKNISIKLGTVFGVQVRIIGKPAGAKAPIRVIWRYPQPGLKSPITGKTKFSDEYTDSRPIGESPVFYWNLAEEWTLVPGTWTLELWQDDRKLLAQDFVLTKL